jgi:hypothetical protein
VGEVMQLLNTRVVNQQIDTLALHMCNQLGPLVFI